MEREGLTFLPAGRISVTPTSPSDNRGLAELPAWLTPFEPHPWLYNGHLQTIAGNFLPRPAFRLPTVAETVEVDPADGSRVLCHCHWQPEAVRAERLTVVLVHGLEGSSDSRYIQGIAARAWAAGMNAVRMNMRNCGGTDALTPTLYHSGRSADVGAVVRYFAARFGLRARGAGWLLHGRQSGAQARRRVGRAATARGCGHGLRGHRSRRRRRCSARAGQPHLRVAFSARIDAAASPQSQALSQHLSRRAA